MPGQYPNPPVNNEAQLQFIVADLFRAQGWKVFDEPREDNLAPDLIAWRKGKKLVVEIKRASEGRRDRVIPLLSQAALEADYYSRNLPDHPLGVAIVGANHIPELLAKEAQQFMGERAPNVAVGLVDLEGFSSFAGHGLESLNSQRRFANNVSSPKLRARAPQLFSDLNQWMLKVLLAPRIPEMYLSAPRGQYQGASQLAEAAGVSVMSAFRFVNEFSKEGFLESASGFLKVVRSRELLNRWKAAGQRRLLEIPMRWILNRGRDSLANAVRSYEVFEGLQNPSPESRVPWPRLCLGLFEAAEALGIGFVQGVKPYLYLERVKEDVLKDLGLSGNSSAEQADVYIRVPGNRESIFRGAVRKNGVPISDILQVWLDVGQHPSRGQEQADLIWRRILSPVFESND